MGICAEPNAKRLPETVDRPAKVQDLAPRL